MKTAVITFPGSNCDDDLVYALEKLAGFQVTRLWHKDSPDLSEYKLVALPGGFSYGDYLRCGAMAAQSPIVAQVKRFAESGGLVLGICNGFQILCESGLLPGALVRNESLKFVCRDVNLRVENSDTPWTSASKTGEVWTIPIGHGDGRYIIDDAAYETMKGRGQILLSYCTGDGKTTAESNPNGSTHAIAGVCNERRNVFGLMPHPERASDLRSRHGMKMWNSISSAMGGSKA